MNAKEIDIPQITTLLRQQADQLVRADSRIAELEKTIKAHAIRPRGKSDATPFANVISQQADRIAELEKQLSMAYEENDNYWMGKQK